MVGLDAGIAKLATLSDGTVFEPVNSFKTNQTKLARLQRQLSKKVKFSSNWKKQKAKIQRLHSHIANTRRDYLHKVTTTYLFTRTGLTASVLPGWDNLSSRCTP